MRRWLYLLPVVVFGLMAAGFYVGLGIDNNVLPSALINEAAPQFDLPPLPGHDKGFSTADLRGLTAGIQKGNTSDRVARHLLAQGDIAAIRYYPYHGIGTALDDLEAGQIGLIIKLFPVISWLVRGRASLAVPLQAPTRERLGIAYAKDRADLADAIDAEVQALRDNGAFARLQAAWPGTETTV